MKIGKDWLDKDYDVVFLHQPVNGVELENGMRYRTETTLPKFNDVPIFSGDIHNPQTVDGITYIGAPHPVKFGDMYECRMLLVEDDAFTYKELKLNPTRKLMLDVSSMKHLEEKQSLYFEGDQVKIRWRLTQDKIGNWPAIQLTLIDWAKKHKMILVSMEASVITDAGDQADSFVIYSEDPIALLEEYAALEKVVPKLVQVGKKLLKGITS